MRTLELSIKDLKSPLKWEYTIKEDGTVFNVSRNCQIKGTSISRNNRYVKIHLDKFRPLHRIVAEHFVPNPDDLPQVNHIDGDRHNNASSNLEWVSPRANVNHAYKTGLKSNKGELNPIRKLTVESVRVIKRMISDGYTNRQIVDILKLPVMPAAVKSIRNGVNWKSVL